MAGLEKFSFPALLLVVLVLGASLRFNALHRQSLWQDEIHTAAYVTDLPSISTVVQRVASRDVHSPLFYIMLRIEHRLGLPLREARAI